MAESVESLRRKLGASPVVRGLTTPELDQIIGLAESKLVRPGDFVFKQGDLADALLIIVQGRVEVVKAEQPLATLGIGEVLGELSLFGGTQRRSAAARATSETLVLRIPSKGFRKLLDESNVAALKVVCNVAHQIAERLTILNEKLIEARKPTKGTLPPGELSALHGWKL